MVIAASALTCLTVGALSGAKANAGLFVLATAALWAAPAAIVTASMVLIEEELVSGGHSTDVVSPLVSVGSNLYYSTALGFRVIVLLAVVATVFTALRGGLRRWKPSPPFLLSGLLAAWTAALALLQGRALQSSLSAASPWILLACGCLLGASFRSSRRAMGVLPLAFGIALTCKAIVGAIVYGLGQAIPDPTGHTAVVYYDSTLSFLAGAALVAGVLSKLSGYTRYLMVIGAATVLLLGMRRNVILAMGAAVAIIAITSRMRGRVWKVIASGAVLIVVLAIVLPGVVPLVGDSLSRGIATLLGTDSDSSTTGHLRDLAVGWSVVQQSPLWGLGVFPSAQAGLVVADSTNLYIHDEYLQTWARFGFGGLVLLIAFLGATFTVALRTLRQPDRDFGEYFFAVYFLALPFALIFFPHLSSEPRFALLSGIACALGCRPKLRASSRDAHRQQSVSTIHDGLKAETSSVKRVKF